MYVVSYVLEIIENKEERVVSPGFHFYFGAVLWSLLYCYLTVEERGGTGVVMNLATRLGNHLWCLNAVC